MCILVYYSLTLIPTLKFRLGLSANNFLPRAETFYQLDCHCDCRFPVLRDYEEEYYRTSCVYTIGISFQESILVIDYSLFLIAKHYLDRTIARRVCHARKAIEEITRAPSSVPDYTRAFSLIPENSRQLSVRTFPSRRRSLSRSS